MSSHADPQNSPDGSIVTMAQRDHVFLSYRSTERPFALKLAASLRSSGVQVWVDCLPDGIRPGDDWPRTLEEALNTCASAVVVLSPEYAASRVCRRELHRVDQLGRVIFPVLLQALRATEWPLEVERLQYADFTSWMDEAAFQSSVAKLLARLHESGTTVVGQRPDAEQQYLLTLIADLEARGGVSQYVALDAELSPHAAPKPSIPSFAAAWGLDAEFALLEVSEPAPAVSTNTQVPQRINVLNLVLTPHVFVLLGDPGAGKTTTLRRLTLEVARKRLDDRHAPLPLLLSLPQWRGEPDAASFIAAHYPLEGDPRPSIASGDIALFLDGLNEMGIHTQTQLALLRQWLSSADAPRRLAMTCRMQDYAEMDLHADRVVIQPMERQRVEQFVTCYLGADAPALLNRILHGSEEVQTSNFRIPRNPSGSGDVDQRSLFTIARNPYLLTCLILLHRSAPDGELPRNTGRIFRRLIRYLWERELRRQTAGWVPFEQGEAKLAELAFHMIDESRPTTVPRAYVNTTIDDKLLRFCERAGVVAVEDKGVRFHHQLIQEYLAAVALVAQPLDTFIAEARWREVIVALSGLLDTPDDMVQLVSSKNCILAARCLLGGAVVEDATTGIVVGNLIHALELLTQRLDAAEDEMQRAREGYVAEHPGMSWGSTAAMDDALEFSFVTRPSNEIQEIVHLLEAFGPAILPWISAASEGPAAARVSALAARLTPGERPLSGS